MEPFSLKEFEILHNEYEYLKICLKNDKIGSETEPTWENCDAKIILTAMIENISECLTKIERSDVNYYRLHAMVGCLYYQEAKILVQIQEIEKAQDVLKDCMELLKGLFLKSEITFLGLRVLNHYCYLLTKTGNLETSESLLEYAESVYKELKENVDLKNALFYSNDDLFEAAVQMVSNKDIYEKLEKLVTSNLQMLAYVYNKQGKMTQFSVYHHEVLKRQLEMREGDATIWAMKTARLGYFFVTRNEFAQARHHLAAACYVLSQYENTLKTLEPNELVLTKWEELNHRYADIAKCWVKYGLFLFNVSKSKLISTYCGESDQSWTNAFKSANPLNRHMSDEEPDVWKEFENNDDVKNSFGTTNLKATETSDSCQDSNVSRTATIDSDEVYQNSESLKSDEKEAAASNVIEQIFDVIFENGNPSDVSIGTVINELEAAPSEQSDIEEKKVEGEQSKTVEEPEPLLVFPHLDLCCFEQCVSCNIVDTLNSARALFNFTHSWLKKSRMFYTLKDHPMEYVNVVLDLSELYRYLAFFEEDIESQYHVQKRRLETLETLSTLLKEVRPPCFLAVSIELYRELAEVQLELMALNLRRLYMTQPETSSHDVPSTSSHMVEQSSEYALHKMEAIADIHQRLEQFGDTLGHGALGDFESSVSDSQSNINEKDRSSSPTDLQAGDLPPFESC